MSVVRVTLVPKAKLYLYIYVYVNPSEAVAFQINTCFTTPTLHHIYHRVHA